ncbi:hypothetical protein F4818DRAFT_456104 [Hypoxylon cercidicola]|nr:hypothetical protein F4818DRAFT_456104 [Hypoxylon cercidicola]
MSHDTAIAATLYLVPPQLEVFYVDASPTFQGINFGVDETVPHVDTGVSSHSRIPNVAIPVGTAIGAFTIGRANSNTTNTYILYQDDGDGLKGPEEVVSDQPSQMSLSEQLDMSRCYYQSGGQIVVKRSTSCGWEKRRIGLLIAGFEPAGSSYSYEKPSRRLTTAPNDSSSSSCSLSLF